MASVVLIFLVIVVAIFALAFWKAWSDGYGPMEFLDWAQWKWSGDSSMKKNKES